MNISFELTRNPDLLHDYFRIREDCFRRDLGIPTFSDTENHFDRNGWIIIAKDGERCIGGARINGSLNNDAQLLPLESPGFIMRDAFPGLDLANTAYCQWTRMALLPEYRRTEAVNQLILSMPTISAALGFKYAFTVSDEVRARLYRRVCRSHGVNYQIVPGVHIPAEKAFVGLEHLLALAEVTPASQSLKIGFDKSIHKQIAIANQRAA